LARFSCVFSSAASKQFRLQLALAPCFVVLFFGIALLCHAAARFKKNFKALHVLHSSWTFKVPLPPLSFRVSLCAIAAFRCCATASMTRLSGCFGAQHLAGVAEVFQENQLLCNGGRAAGEAWSAVGRA
jgi:hypothetical protein